jgi:ribosomal protein L11 methyltransferase
MWVWSKLSGVQWADAWEERFYGNANAVITELKGGKSVRVDVYCDSEKGGEAIQQEFGGSVRYLKKEKWEKPRHVNRAPLMIRDRLVITQDDRATSRGKLEKKYPGRYVMIIPPEMAFGTGNHPTTATCLRFLTDEAKRRKGEEWRMLDLGCGSGVLVMAGRLLGAGESIGLDYDPKAVEVTERNLERNAVDGVEVAEADVLKWSTRRKYEVVAANLFAGVLWEAFPRMERWVKKDGRLILSGILFDQWEETRKVAVEVGLEVLEHRRKGKWVSAFLRRRGDG